MRYRIIIQYFGGRGAGAGGRYGGGGDNITILSTTSLVSEREGKENLVDQTLNTFRDAKDTYGTVVDNIEVATLGGRSAQGTLAYYDGANIAVNKNFFNDRMEDAYKACVKTNFHPNNGNKTGLEATIAHEIGHALNDQVGAKLGKGFGQIDEVATMICKEALKNTRHRGVVQMARAISEYATHSNAETIAEAYCDVYCNGNKAKAESKAIMDVMNKYLR